jgi:hypothetical protein
MYWQVKQLQTSNEIRDNSLVRVCIFTSSRKDAEVSMEGQFLVRQIYEDEITYNLIQAAVKVLRKFPLNFQVLRLTKYLLKS